MRGEYQSISLKARLPNNGKNMGREAAWGVEGLPGAGVGKAGTVRFYWGNLRYMCVRLSNGLYTILSNQQNGLLGYLLWQDPTQRVHRKMRQHPQQLRFHPNWAQLPRQVPPPRFRCTRDIPKFPAMMYRPRTDSEELNLRMANLWIHLYYFICDLYAFTPINPLIKPNLRDIRVSLGKDCLGHA